MYKAIDVLGNTWFTSKSKESFYKQLESLTAEWKFPKGFITVKVVI